MIEFLRKFENHDIKITRVNSIIIIKSINLQLFTLFFYGVGVRRDRRDINRKVDAGRFYVVSRFVANETEILITVDSW